MPLLPLTCAHAPLVLFLGIGHIPPSPRFRPLLLARAGWFGFGSLFFAWVWKKPPPPPRPPRPRTQALLNSAVPPGESCCRLSPCRTCYACPSSQASFLGYRPTAGIALGVAYPQPSVGVATTHTWAAGMRGSRSRPAAGAPVRTPLRTCHHPGWEVTAHAMPMPCRCPAYFGQTSPLPSLFVSQARAR